MKSLHLLAFVALPDTQTDYNWVRDEYFAHWDKAKKEYSVPYFPDVTMGWDPTPHCDIKSEWANVRYPFMNTIKNNTPENFKKALEITREKLLSDPNGPRILNIDCLSPHASTPCVQNVITTQIISTLQCNLLCVFK